MSKPNNTSETPSRAESAQASCSELPGDYVPYGPEWAKELSRLTKPQIIGMYRSALIEWEHLSEENEANAQLLAAAPKLLTLAQKLAAWDKRWPKWSDTNGTSEKELNAICEEAHAIIAEASGQNV